MDDQEKATALFRRLREVVADDARLAQRGRFLTADLLIGVGTVPFLVRVAEGRVAAVEQGPFLLRPSALAIRGAADAWLRFWERTPAPGWHDLSALAKRGAVTIEGDIRCFMAHLQFIKDLLAVPRRAATEG
jgi:hypothetical protein